MSTEVIKVLDAVCEKLGLAIDWTSKNMLPVAENFIHQYGMYLLVQNIFTTILALFVFIFGIILLKKTTESFSKGTWARDHELRYIESYSGTGVTCMILALLGIPAGFLLFIFEGLELIKAITIPEIYAIESILNLISQTS